MGGDTFGDITIDGGSVVCNEDTHVISLSKDSLKKTLFGQQETVMKMKVSSFRSFSFFKYFPDSAVMRMLTFGGIFTI